MQKRVILTVTNDLISDQRVHKVCLSLKKNNFDVLLIGTKNKTTPKISGRIYKTERFLLIFKSSFLFYAEYNIRLFFLLLFRKCDILIANDLDTLPAAFLTSKIKNKELIYDSHELFTEVPELIGRKAQKVWLFIERLILPKVKKKYTVCSSIAEFYKKKYNSEFHVVRNVPLKRKLNKVPKIENRRVILYQGALNLGRGIELMIDSMKLTDNAVLWIAGTGDLEANLKQKVKYQNLEQKVLFLGKIPFQELAFYTGQADVGLSLEENRGLNYYFALPNKLFDYIQAGVPVIVSPFPEMKKIIETYELGETLVERTPEALSGQINTLLSDKNKLETFKKNSAKAAEKLIWEKEEEKLIELIVSFNQ